MTSDQNTQGATIAAIYCRVSGTRQVKKGDGLGSQEARCREYATYKGHEVAAVFREEGVSGGIADRPAMKEMLAWLRKHRHQNPVAIIDDISRIARGVEAHWKLRGAIGSVGATLESPSIEFGDDSDSQLIENMLASVSQHHRQKNAEQVVHRMTARLKSGYYAFWAPTGYTYVAAKGQGKVLERDEPLASLIQDALEGFATGRFATQAEVKRFLEPHPIFSRDVNGHIHPQRVKNMLTNRIYAGYYAYKPWGVPLTKGRHPAIISLATYERIQERLGAVTSRPNQTETTDEFPLRGFVTCAACDKPLTGYWAKGRNKRYAYYECFNKSCAEFRKTTPRDTLEGAFEALVKNLRPSADIMATVAAMFRDIWNDRTAKLGKSKVEQKQTLKALDARIGKLTDRLIETESPATIRAYEGKLEKLEAQKALFAENLTKAPTSVSDFDTEFRTAMNFLANPWNLWVSKRPKDRKTLLKLVFASPLPYARKKGFRTAKTTIPFRVLGDLSDPEKEMADRQSAHFTCRHIGFKANLQIKIGIDQHYSQQLLIGGRYFPPSRSDRG